MEDRFSINQIDDDTYITSEWKQEFFHMILFQFICREKQGGFDNEKGRFWKRVEIMLHQYDIGDDFRFYFDIAFDK